MDEARYLGKRIFATGSSTSWSFSSPPVIARFVSWRRFPGSDEQSLSPISKDYSCIVGCSLVRGESNRRAEEVRAGLFAVNRVEGVFVEFFWRIGVTKGAPSIGTSRVDPLCSAGVA